MVRQLGDPFALNPQEDPQPGFSGEERPLQYLSPKVSAPFFAAAMLDAGIQLQFPKEEEDPAMEELGLASRSRDTKKTPRPYIPVLKFLQNYVAKIQGKDSRGKDRVKWVERSFAAPPDMEAQYLRPAPIPAGCWKAMTDDSFSWCVPDPAPPLGVEGGSAASKPQKPHKVFPWNQDRDNELRNLEALARDGLRVANASLITFAHAMNGLLNPSRALSEEAKKRLLFTLRDVEYVSAEKTGPAIGNSAQA
jgi:hypothetical protein